MPLIADVQTLLGTIISALGLMFVTLIFAEHLGQLLRLGFGGRR